MAHKMRDILNYFEICAWYIIKQVSVGETKIFKQRLLTFDIYEKTTYIDNIKFNGIKLVFLSFHPV